MKKPVSEPTLKTAKSKIKEGKKPSVHEKLEQYKKEIELKSKTQDKTISKNRNNIKQSKSKKKKAKVR